MQTSNSPIEQYLSLMSVIRTRFDLIHEIIAINGDDFSKAEICAFHARKIFEGIAFGCLVAIENGMKRIPGDAKGQWNAQKIMRSLRAKQLAVFPSPSEIRNPTESERMQFNVKSTIQGQPDRRLTPNELDRLYERMHKWLHEINPYVEKGRQQFVQNYGEALKDDLLRLERFVERHTISIAGEMMFCVLRDKIDGHTKIVPLSKIASLFPLSANK
jgi:hypothetical protein